MASEKSIVKQTKRGKKNVDEGSRLSHRQLGHLLKMFKGVRDNTTVFFDSKTGQPLKKNGGDIPFNWGPLFRKGTQAPVIRLYFSQNAIALVATTAYTTVYTVQAVNLLNFSELDDVFTEYRVLRGELNYHRTYSTQNNATTGAGLQMVAVIDYDISTSLTDANSGESYDTKRKFVPAFLSGVPPKDPIVWPLEFEKLPDEEWIDVATSNQAFAYWKPFISSAHTFGTISQVGYTCGWLDVQFRGLR